MLYYIYAHTIHCLCSSSYQSEAFQASDHTHLIQSSYSTHSEFELPTISQFSGYTMKNLVTARAYQVALQARNEDENQYPVGTHTELIYPKTKFSLPKLVKKPSRVVSKHKRRKEDLTEQTSDCGSPKVTDKKPKPKSPLIQIAMELSHPHSSAVMLLQPTHTLKRTSVRFSANRFIKTRYCAYFREPQIMPLARQQAQPSLITLTSELSTDGYLGSESAFNSNDTVSVPFRFTESEMLNLFAEKFFASRDSTSFDSASVESIQRVDQSVGSSDDEVIYAKRPPSDLKIVTVVDKTRKSSNNFLQTSGGTLADLQLCKSEQKCNLSLPKLSHTVSNESTNKNDSKNCRKSELVSVKSAQKRKSSIPFPKLSVARPTGKAASLNTSAKQARVKTKRHLPAVHENMNHRACIHGLSACMCKMNYALVGKELKLTDTIPWASVMIKNKLPPVETKNMWLEAADAFYGSKLLTRSTTCNEERWRKR